MKTPTLERNKQIVELYQVGNSLEEVASLVNLTVGSTRKILRDNGYSFQSSEDLTGQRFTRLTVLKLLPSSNHQSSRNWLCRCDCGVEKVVAFGHLKSGHTQSCGCLQRERAADGQLKHGQSRRGKRTVEYELWRHAKRRAREQNVLFTLKIESIIIPETCPALGIPLKPNIGVCGFDSPTLDRLIPSLGYTIENTRVISFRANSVKQDATAEELHKVADWIERELLKYGGRISYAEQKNKSRTPEYYMYASAKYRAIERGIPFELELNDIHFPDVCPALGTLLVRGTRFHSFDSPSLDRLIPEKGYTPENTRIISRRANTIKQNATFEEIRAVARWLDFEDGVDKPLI